MSFAKAEPMRRVILCWLCLTAPAAAQSLSAPGTYSLFNPTPDSQLRMLDTDRPGKSHSPLTVDPGHIQIESDFYNYSFDRWSPDHATTRESIYTDPNLKLGVNQWSELDAILPLYETEEQRLADGQTFRARGVGDLQLGGKVNFWGNSGGDTAFGAIGFIKVPTATGSLGNGRVEGVLNTPFQTTLPLGFSLTAEPGIAFERNQANTAYVGDTQFILNLNHPVVVSAVTAAIELYIDHSADPATGNRDTIDPSLQWQIGKNLQLDLGAYFGLTKAAVDENPYVGISVRY